MSNEIVLGIKLKADGKELVGEVKVSAAEIDKLGGATKRGSSEAAALNAQHKSLAETLNGLASKIGAYTIGWNVATDAIMKAGAAVKDYIKDAALLNARHETMGVVMEVVGRNAGYSRREMDLYAESVRKSGITMIASREGVVKMVQANLDLADAGKLARAAQDAAVIANINSSEAFTRLIYAIQSGQPEMLRTMGINVNFEDSYKKLAKQLGVTTEQLTQQEKVQARANVTLEATARITGTYEAAMGTAGKMMNSLARYTEDLKVLRGEVFNEALVIAVNAYTDSLKQADTETRRLAESKKLQEWGRDLITVFSWVGDIIIGAYGGIASAVELTTLSTMRAINGLRNAALMAVPGGRIMASLFGGLTGTDIDAYINSFGAKVGENVNSRLGRKQFRASAEEYYQTRAADAAARAARQVTGDEWLSFAKTPPKPEARPEGKTVAEQVSEYSKLAVVLQQKLDLDKESTEVQKLQFALTTMLASQRKEISAAEEKDLFRMARLLDLKKQAAEAMENDAKNEEALAKMRLEGAQAAANYDKQRLDGYDANQKNIEQIAFETSLIGLSNEAREQAIALRAMEAAGIKRSDEAYEGEARRLREALAARQAAQQADDIRKKSLEAYHEDWKRTNDIIERGLSDSLMRGFDKGKGFARSFWDSMVNMSKTVVLTPVIKYIVSPLSGAITTAMSGMGFSGAAGAAGGGMNLVSGASSLFGGGGLLGSAALTTNAGIGGADFFTSVAAGDAIAGTGSGILGSMGGAGAAMAAIPGWGWAALGAAAIAAYMSSGEDDPNRGKYEFSGLASSSTIGRRGLSSGAYYDFYGANGAQWGSLSQGQMTQVNNAIAQVFDAMEKQARDAGLAVAGLDALTVRMGVTGQGVQKDLETAVLTTGEAIAEQLIPNIRDLQIQGETLAQTFARVTAAQLQAKTAVASMTSAATNLLAEVQGTDPAFERYIAQVRAYDAAIGETSAKLSQLDMAAAIEAEKNLLAMTGERYKLELDYLTAIREIVASTMKATGDFRAQVQQQIQGLTGEPPSRTSYQMRAVADWLTEQTLKDLSGARGSMLYHQGEYEKQSAAQGKYGNEAVSTRVAMLLKDATASGDIAEQFRLQRMLDEYTAIKVGGAAVAAWNAKAIQEQSDYLAKLAGEYTTSVKDYTAAVTAWVGSAQEAQKVMQDYMAAHDKLVRGYADSIATINELQHSIELGRATPAGRTGMMGADFAGAIGATAGLTGDALFNAVKAASSSGAGYIESIRSAYGGGAAAQMLTEGVLNELGTLKSSLSAEQQAMLDTTKSDTEWILASLGDMNAVLDEIDSTLSTTNDDIVAAITANKDATVTQLKLVLNELTKQTEQLSNVNLGLNMAGGAPRASAPDTATSGARTADVLAAAITAR